MTSLPVLARACARHAVARPAGPAALAALALLGVTAAAGLPAAQAASQQAAGGHVIGVPAAGDVPVPATPDGSVLLPAGVAPSVAASAAAAQQLDVAPVGKLMRVDILVVSHDALPSNAAAKVARLPGVQAARAVDAARIQVNGKFVAMLGVDPSTFRDFAAGPTARSSQLWRNVAAGGIAVSYTMGRQDKLPLGGTVQVNGRQREALRVGGFGTVGIGGVDAVVSAQVARSLGFPVGNAIMVSAPHAQIASLVRKIKAKAPHGTLVEPLVTTAATGQPGPGQRGRHRQRRASQHHRPAGQRADHRPAHRHAEGRGQPGRPAVRMGCGRAELVRLLRAGAVVLRPGRHCHAAGGRRPGAHRARRAGEPVAAG